MADIDNIKDRIRKLMAMAHGTGDTGGATDAEIESALKHAARLIDAHHLEAAEFEPKRSEDEDKMGMAGGKTESPKFHAWETNLARAIDHLFGCTKHYVQNQAVPYLVDGVAQFYTGKYAGQRKMCKVVVFYGPLIEAQEAAELYSEWCKLIAALGVMRWGGAYKSHGAKYCEGFAQALCNKAYKINTERALVAAKPLKMLPGETEVESKVMVEGVGDDHTAITLKGRYEALQERATIWLEEEAGVTLNAGHSRAGSKKGTNAAFREGLAHGEGAEFGRRTKRRQIEGPKGE